MNYLASYFGKCEKVKKEDIEQFINKKFEECKNLDYKQFDILKNAEKVCKHVCAFANSEGGLLVIGVSELEEAGRIYPDKITWGDSAYTKEQLENILLGNITPHPRVDIIPIRKSEDDDAVIFIINVHKSFELHMTHDRFFKRVNFQSLPMQRDEIISFINQRLNFDECAMFRFQLRDFIYQIIDELLARLIPDTNFEKRAHARENMVQTIKTLIDDWTAVKETIFLKVPIREIIVFADHIETMYKNDVKSFRRYPHDRITADEKILFIELKDLMDSFAISYLRRFFASDAEAHNVELDFRDSPSEFEKKTKHLDHVKDILSGDLTHLRQILEIFLKIIVIISTLESEYGLLRESSSVKGYFD